MDDVKNSATPNGTHLPEDYPRIDANRFERSPTPCFTRLCREFSSSRIALTGDFLIDSIMTRDSVE